MPLLPKLQAIQVATSSLSFWFKTRDAIPFHSLILTRVTPENVCISRSLPTPASSLSACKLMCFLIWLWAWDGGHPCIQLSEYETMRRIRSHREKEERIEKGGLWSKEYRIEEIEIWPYEWTGHMHTEHRTHIHTLRIQEAWWALITWGNILVHTTLYVFLIWKSLAHRFYTQLHRIISSNSASF